MKATAIRSENVEIDISTSEITKLLLSGEYDDYAAMVFALEKKWLEKLKFIPDSYVDEHGMWVEEWEEYGGSHSWTRSEKRREATQEEIRTFEMFQALRRLVPTLR